MAIEPRPVRREVGAQQADQVHRSLPGLRTPCRITSTISSGMSGVESVRCGWLAANVMPRSSSATRSTGSLKCWRVAADEEREPAVVEPAARLLVLELRRRLGHAHHGHQPEDPEEPLLQQARVDGQPLAQRQVGVDLREPLEELLRVELPLEHRVEQLVLGREAAEDRALGDAGRLGDQLGRGVLAVQVEQRPGRLDDRLAPVLRREALRALAATLVEASGASLVAHGQGVGHPDTLSE